MKQKHYFHITYVSPWPLLVSFYMAALLLMLVVMLNKKIVLSSFWGLLLFFVFVIFVWWRDVNRESCFQGFHSSSIFTSLRVGMMLFIISECMFFLSVFWSYLYSSLSPSIDLSNNWPPFLISVNVYDIPLLNTMILLSSGLTVTMAHHYLLLNKTHVSGNYMLLTVVLGFYFTMCQFYEYLDTQFTMFDSAYGSCFFLSTGFHGIHVLWGTFFIISSYQRLVNSYFSSYHHIGLECSIWYWHFVDVVWLFLFVIIYWWSV